MSNPIDQVVAAASDMTIEYLKRTVESAKYRPVNDYDVAYNDGIKTALKLIEIFQLEMKMRQGDLSE